MNPDQIAAWALSIAKLANAGVQVAGVLQRFLPQAHPDLTPAELDAAYDAIMADDAVRAALSRQAAGETDSSGLRSIGSTGE